MYKSLVALFFVWFGPSLHSQCNYNGYPRATSGIKYVIDAKLDTKSKSVTALQHITFKNKSNSTLYEVRLYMYMNSFQNMKSTFLKGSNGVIFGTDISKRTENEWGYIKLTSITNKNTNAKLPQKYIQPDDQNLDDQSVVSITLDTPLKPNETLELDLNFTSKLPKFIARAGYSRDDYYAFLHWFPQLGVYEQNDQQKWYWNCHQFFRGTEFYGDFSDFEVNLILPQKLKLGHTGCILSETTLDSEYKKIRIAAYDVIDFAWIAYPHFDIYHDQWQDVKLKLCIPPEHKQMLESYTRGLKNSLQFFNDRVGRYPYPAITLVDPPIHGLGSGFMEYPMMITCASFCYVPSGIRTIESLAVHEFSHQFFMAVVSNNEKEAAWMDEGFVTFFEDEIMDHYYGNKNSIFDILGFKSGNAEQSRLEYTEIATQDIGITARPGWTITDRSYKPLFYAKPSLMLQTLKHHFGEENFYKALRYYFNTFKFKHPKEKDFISSMKSVLGDTLAKGMSMDTFFYKVLHTQDYCDYSIQYNHGKAFLLNNKGRLALPVTVEIKYENGGTKVLTWQGASEYKIDDDPNIQSITIDPKFKVPFDINYNNNSYTKKSTSAKIQIGTKTTSIWQAVLQSLSYLLC